MAKFQLSSPKAFIYGGMTLVLVGGGLAIYKSLSPKPVTVAAEEFQQEASELRKAGNSALPAYKELCVELAKRYALPLGLVVAGIVFVLKGANAWSALVSMLGGSIEALESENNRLRSNLSKYNPEACNPHTVVVERDDGTLVTVPEDPSEGTIDIYSVMYTEGGQCEFDAKYAIDKIKTAIREVQDDVDQCGVATMNDLIGAMGLSPSSKSKNGFMQGFDADHPVDVWLVVDSNTEGPGTMSFANNDNMSIFRSLSVDQRCNGFWINICPCSIINQIQNSYEG